jgi:hypothetical protein
MQRDSPLDREANQLPTMVMLAAVDGQVSSRHGQVVADVRVEWFERSPAMAALFTEEALRSNKPIYVPGIDGVPMTIERLERLVGFYQYGSLTGTQGMSFREACAFAMLAQKYDGTWVSRNHHENLSTQAINVIVRLTRNMTEQELEACINAPAEQRFNNEEITMVDATLGWARLQPNRDADQAE